MSTWNLLCDAENSFRWEISGSDAIDIPENILFCRDPSSLRFPSMRDLLLQGCSKHLELSDGVGEDLPMFRTGSGKSVKISQTSIARALSVLDGDDDTYAGSKSSTLPGVEVQSTDNEYDLPIPNSLFQTGSGKVVNISSAGLCRAKTLLGLDKNDDQCHFGSQVYTRKIPIPYEHCEWIKPPDLDVGEYDNDMQIGDRIQFPIPQLNPETGLLGSESKREGIFHIDHPEMETSSFKSPPIKFHTAGGRSLSVSTDALQRARSLLGETDPRTLINERGTDNPVILNKSFSHDSFSNKRKPCYFSHQEMTENKQISKSFISPLRSSSNQKLAPVIPENKTSGFNLIKLFDAEACNNVCMSDKETSRLQRPVNQGPCPPLFGNDNSLTNGNGSDMNVMGKSSRRPLVDISNTTSHTSNKGGINAKRKLGMKSSLSPFKRPRSSRLSAPLHSIASIAPPGSSNITSKNSSSKKRVSTRYPFTVSRMDIKEFFKAPSSYQNVLGGTQSKLTWVSPDNAVNYVFCDGSSVDYIGAGAFCEMLAQSGSSVQYASKEWVANHYKWIIWKLACYDRFHSGKFMTVPNVLEELKYRYEREVNYGHRSAIKKILDGDSPAASMMVLCISAIRFDGSKNNESKPSVQNMVENHCGVKLELTDGWYSVDAILDAPLSKQLAAGKLFVGQKIRICGAGLCGWDGPVSPLEVPRTASLALHINGTYRACWADKLGLCKAVGAPLAFRCIKSDGGSVPLTLVGVMRIYPVLYKERLKDGGSIVRSKRMESRITQLYNQSCAAIAEDIVFEYQSGTKESRNDDFNDSEEGAKILKILETSAEPEILMAEMSSEQLTSFTSYQAKLEATRQLDMQNSIQKALRDAGLSTREVIPFMRVRVVGLTSKKKHLYKEGLITIWNPTEMQQEKLVEGQAYAVQGLVPLKTDSEMLYLQARGSTTKWQQLSLSTVTHFEPFFSPRKSILMSNLGEIPLSSEFDIAVLVVYVGEAYTAAHQRKQWVFATDNSIPNLEESPNSLLAISFCSPYNHDDSFSPINCNLAGSTAGFFNLIKKAKDKMNNIWIAEATENSAYVLNDGIWKCSHLKHAADKVQRWAKTSDLITEKLRHKILSIIGGHR